MSSAQKSARGGEPASRAAEDWRAGPAARSGADSNAESAAESDGGSDPSSDAGSDAGSDSDSDAAAPSAPGAPSPQAPGGTRERTAGRSLLQLGDYEMLDRLGSGGMAEVYLARHGNVPGLEQTVVLKRVLPHLARDEHFLEMFLDEARIVASLNHPNVVRTIEIGCADQSYFLALELVQGESLADLWGTLRKRHKRFPVPLATFIIAQLAHGLHHAHTLADVEGKPLGIVHRDVSPQNALVSLQGDVKLIDFGVAKAQNRISHTDFGRAKGKAGYMAPEQARGEPVDARTDVFALGIVLWELLSGERLFRRADVIASSRAVCDERAPSLAATLGIAPSLDAIVQRALAKNPRMRFTSAGDLAAALESQVESSGAASEATRAALARFFHETFPDRVQRWRQRMAGAQSTTASSLLVPPAIQRKQPELSATPAALTPARTPDPKRRRAMALGGAIAALVLGLVLWLPRPQPLPMRDPSQAFAPARIQVEPSASPLLEGPAHAQLTPLADDAPPAASSPVATPAVGAVPGADHRPAGTASAATRVKRTDRRVPARAGSHAARRPAAPVRKTPSPAALDAARKKSAGSQPVAPAGPATRRDGRPSSFKPNPF